MVRVDPVEILKKHGLYTEEFQVRAKILDAVVNKRWNDPILRETMTPEQIEQMKSAPQQGGAFPVPKDLLAKAKEVTNMPEAKTIAEQGMTLAKVDSLPAGFSDPRGAIQDKIGKFVDSVPAVQNIKKQFEGKDPINGISSELDYDKTDGFITTVVKFFLNTITDIVSSPALPIYVRFLFGFMFVLSYLQGLPIFGGLIRAALEITTFLVTTAGTSILSMGNMAGPIGHMVGLMFASVFFVLSAMISFSRKQFTDAIVVSANLIPFVGMPISNALQRADIAATKLYGAQKQVYNSFIDLLGAVFNIKGRVRGGIRFSRRRKTIKKWRTMRRKLSVTR
jgi:hypothetical protein